MQPLHLPLGVARSASSAAGTAFLKIMFYGTRGAILGSCILPLCVGQPELNFRHIKRHPGALDKIWCRMYARLTHRSLIGATPYSFQICRIEEKSKVTPGGVLANLDLRIAHETVWWNWQVIGSGNTVKHTSSEIVFGPVARAKIAAWHRGWLGRIR